MQDIPKYRMLSFVGWIIILTGVVMICTGSTRLVGVVIDLVKHWGEASAGKPEPGVIDHIKSTWDAVRPVLAEGIFPGVLWIGLGYGVRAFRDMVAATMTLAAAVPDPNAPKATPVPAGKNWRIVGSDTMTGGDAKIIVTAANEADARAAALKQHVKAKEVEPMT